MQEEFDSGLFLYAVCDSTVMNDICIIALSVWCVFRAVFRQSYRCLAHPRLGCHGVKAAPSREHPNRKAQKELVQAIAAWRHM